MPEQARPPQQQAPPQTFRGAIKFFGKGRESWDNNITITESAMLCEFGDKSLGTITAPLAAISTISYGQKATRPAAGFLSDVASIPQFAPAAILGLPALLHKTRHHYVSVTWSDQEGECQSAYFEIKGSHIRRFLKGLSFRSGKPIYATADDQKYLGTHGVLARPDPGMPANIFCRTPGPWVLPDLEQRPTNRDEAPI